MDDVEIKKLINRLLQGQEAMQIDINGIKTNTGVKEAFKTDKEDRVTCKGVVPKDVLIKMFSDLIVGMEQSENYCYQVDISVEQLKTDD